MLTHGAQSYADNVLELRVLTLGFQKLVREIERRLAGTGGRGGDLRGCNATVDEVRADKI